MTDQLPTDPLHGVTLKKIQFAMKLAETISFW